MPRYTPATIEPKWQRYWDEHKTFKTPEMPPEGKHAEKLYVLDMFPYPSGSGLHVGHPEGYTATDIVCRFARMNGKCVLHPMGFDAFGLPAEEHAIKTNTPPRVNTEQNIAVFRRQLKMLGFSYDWARERGGHPVVRMPLRQWMLRITAYADRLEKDLEPLDWPEGIKKLQRDWIGRSVGAEVDFFIGSPTIAKAAQEAGYDTDKGKRVI